MTFPGKNPVTRVFLIAILVVSCSSCMAPPEVDTGPRVEHWIEALRESDARVRKEAAFKLGNLGLTEPERIVPALMGALRDADAAVRCEAILALLKCGPDAEEAVGELSELQQNDGDPRVREYAGEALEKLGKDE